MVTVTEQLEGVLHNKNPRLTLNHVKYKYQACF